jgi:hypothetical protein
MNDNLIGNDGCSAAAVALRQNAVLISVSLCPAGAVALAETLRINASVQVLGWVGMTLVVRGHGDCGGAETQ